MAQEHTQKRKIGNDVINVKSDDVSVPLNKGNSGTAERQTTYVNSRFRYDETAKSMCEDIHGICMMAFTNSCSMNGSPLLRGNLCEHHNMILLGRAFANIHIEGSVSSVPVPMKNCIYKPQMVLTSMMPLNMKQEEIDKLLIEVSGWGSDEKAQICKFLCLLAAGQDKFVNNESKIMMDTYTNELVLQCQRQLQDKRLLINNINIPMLITEEYYQNSQNDFFDNIDLKHATSETNDGKKLYFVVVPLNQFNMLDIIFFLSYHLEPSSINVGLAGNCKIANGQFVHGVGFGLRNTFENYRTVYNESVITGYPKPIQDVLKTENFIFNMDVMVMSYAPREGGLTEKLIQPILKRTDPQHSFDVTRIHFARDRQRARG